MTLPPVTECPDCGAKVFELTLVCGNKRLVSTKPVKLYAETQKQQPHLKGKFEGYVGYVPHMTECPAAPQAPARMTEEAMRVVPGEEPT